MFVKALVIATATALKLQAQVELSSLAGVNIQALSSDELAQLKAATRDAFEKVAHDAGAVFMTKQEHEARHEVFMTNVSQVEQMHKDDPDFDVGYNEMSLKSAEEKARLQGTKRSEALAEEDRTPVKGRMIDEETELAQTGDLWNTVYPGCIYTYQYIHDAAVQQNPSWGCQSFFTWDSDWLEHSAYVDYYNYYVVSGYCSEAYLRSWWNANIISWREELRDYLDCVQEQQNDDEGNGGSDDTPNANNCDNVNVEECIWGDEYVTPVKSQGSCGSCYAFSAAQILESYNAIAGNGLISLSEQQIVDCGYGNNGGCNGGWPASVLGSTKESSNALWPEADYEYHASVSTCKTKSSTRRVKTDGSVVHQRNLTRDSMKNALLNGPLAITVDANDKFMAYSGGILRNCTYGQLNHAVNAVGWTVMNGVEVLKVRNSWGTWWGDEGHVYVAMDDSACNENGGLGPAGIFEHAVYAKATMA